MAISSASTRVVRNVSATTTRQSRRTSRDTSLVIKTYHAQGTHCDTFHLQQSCFRRTTKSIHQSRRFLRNRKSDPTANKRSLHLRADFVTRLVASESAALSSSSSNGRFFEEARRLVEVDDRCGLALVLVVADVVDRCCDAPDDELRDETVDRCRGDFRVCALLAMGQPCCTTRSSIVHPHRPVYNNESSKFHQKAVVGTQQ
jgi:hypothetical protein